MAISAFIGLRDLNVISLNWTRRLSLSERTDPRIKELTERNFLFSEERKAKVEMNVYFYNAISYYRTT